MVPELVLVDAGPLVAMLRQSDQHHAICVEQARQLRTPLLTCWPVLTEAAWLLRQHSAALQRLFRAFDEEAMRLLELPAASLPELAQFLKKYRDAGAQLADAALVYLADRHNIHTIFTLDRRDFSIYRGKDKRAFMLLPEL